MKKKALLEAVDINVQFNGVKAANNVNVEINEGELLAIIGSNGSGKTTFLNLCTGYIRPTSGEIYLEGKAITKMPPRLIARKGIARAFQIPQLFFELSLRENLMLAIASREGIFDLVSPLDCLEYRNEAMSFLELMGLSDMSEKPARVLPEGLRKLADIAVALALKPRLLLLDEPTSGVSSLDRFKLMETLMLALKKSSVTALFVEHDMDIVSRYADRVLVWESGNVIDNDIPEVVMKNPDVIERVIGDPQC
ncbi:ABC transporter ATP-binding protein [Chromohalobacter japonicus]|uniref:ABC transporter ATP-binding protein n=1 Tax=Chromohalobacter japonicus TaxID=223900 RepID=A0A1Q8THV2_9GAMM|nr:ATP-binding cassette domain-containing protein [Chromohalobacter japonicus]OLO13267.1 ABC transporter ATP-binding protein [Chromohalobacter japonicus]